MHPEMKQVIPLAPEFIRNTDGTTVQDCETKAGKCLLDYIRRSHRQLPAIIVADSLYSNQPFIEELTAQRFSFILGAKPSDHKSLYQDIEGLRSGKLLNQVQPPINAAAPITTNGSTSWRSMAVRTAFR